MFSEKDLRVLNEYRKDHERAASKYRAAREAKAPNARGRRTHWTARLVALFL